MGAWIEITQRRRGSDRHATSHPTWVRGLKFFRNRKQTNLISVAPHVGAWIEIYGVSLLPYGQRSHPTWVRGLKLSSLNAIAAQARSHPTWVRGLKCSGDDSGIYAIKSHPTWVRGLKSTDTAASTQDVASHPTWVRGLKSNNITSRGSKKSRTPRGCVD